MPTRREIAEFERCCEVIIGLINHNPEVLTNDERLGVEICLTRLLSTIVRAEQTIS